MCILDYFLMLVGVSGLFMIPLGVVFRVYIYYKKKEEQRNTMCKEDLYTMIQDYKDLDKELNGTDNNIADEIYDTIGTDLGDNAIIISALGEDYRQLLYNCIVGFKNNTELKLDKAKCKKLARLFTILANILDN